MKTSDILKSLVIVILLLLIPFAYCYVEFQDLAFSSQQSAFSNSADPVSAQKTEPVVSSVKPKVQKPNIKALTPKPETRNQKLETDKILAKTAKLQMPFIENQGQMDKSVKFYANTFAGNVYITEKGEVVYALQKRVASSEERVESKKAKDPVAAGSSAFGVQRNVGADLASAQSKAVASSKLETRNLKLGTNDSSQATNNEPRATKFAVLKETLIGAKELNPKGENKAVTKVNYFVGDKKNWKTNIQSWNEVSLGEVYDGVELKLKAYGKNVEKLFTVKPGGKVEDIRIKIAPLPLIPSREGRGSELLGKNPHQSSFSHKKESAQKSPSPLAGEGRGEGSYNAIKVNSFGELEIATELGKVKFTKPYAYQEIDGKRVEVGCEFKVSSSKFQVENFKPETLNFKLETLKDKPQATNNGQRTTEYGFTVASYNSKYSLVIDPLLASTFIGGIKEGGGKDYANSVVIDSNGNVFVTGYTGSSNYPITSGVYDTSFNGEIDVFISKLNNSLTSLLASTFIGGSSNDYGNSSAIDSSGNIFVTGYTESIDFPTTPGAYDTSLYGRNDVFISKLDNNLTSLLSSTYLGGSLYSYGYSIGLDSDGNVFVTGYTGGLSDGGVSIPSNFPTTPGAYDTSFSGWYDVFISKFNNNLSSLLASTFIGNFSINQAYSLAIDFSGNIFVTGIANSGFPTTPGAYDTSVGGYSDIFVSKLNNNLSSLLASTYLGGNNYEQSRAIATDSSGNIFVSGWTKSSNYPTTPGAYDTSYNGYNDVFVSKLNNNLTSLLSSTFVGIGGVDTSNNSCLAIDSENNIYLSGRTFATGYYPFPTTSGAYDTSPNGGEDVFVSKLSNNLTSLLFSTLIGGDSSDSGNSIAIDSSGNIFVTGCAGSPNYPITLGAYDTSFNDIPGFLDSFVSKLNGNLSSLSSSTFLGSMGGGGSDYGNSIALDSDGNIFIVGNTATSDYPTTSGAYDTSYNGTFAVGYEYYFYDVLVSKLNNNLTSLLSSTFLGGPNSDYGNSLAIDSSGNIFITGYTRSANYPTTPGAYDTSYNSGDDVFISKLNNNLSLLLASTFLGGTSGEQGNSIVIASGGNVFVTGSTGSSNYPVILGSYDTSYNSWNDVFVTKLNNSLSSLLASTFLGGSNDDFGYSSDIDSGGNIFVAGWTLSSNYPTTLGAYDISHNGNKDVIVSKLDNNLTSLLSSTFIGQNNTDEAHAISLSSTGDVYLSGITFSDAYYSYPTTPGAYDISFNGGPDAFISKLNNFLSSLLASTFLGGSGSNYANSLAIDSIGNIFITGYTWSSNYPTTIGAYDTSINAYGGYNDVFVSKLNSSLSSLLASTFIGGSLNDNGKSLAIDSGGNIIVTGETYSSDYPATPGAFDNSHNSPGYYYPDIFISKLDSNLSAGEGVPTAITLSSFTAEARGGMVVLKWETGTEIDNLGFNILRSEKEDGNYARINKRIISAMSNATTGASYEFWDKNVRGGKTYFYKLIDIDRNGTKTSHGPVSVKVSFRKKGKR